MRFDDYKIVIYRNQPDGWVAEIPAIAGCHALMPTAEDAVTELAKVFRLIEEEHRASGIECRGWSGSIACYDYSIRLTIRLLRETDGRWIGDVPELPGVTAYGESPEEATTKAKALALRVLAEEIEYGEMKPVVPEQMGQDGIFAALRRSPLVGADLNLERHRAADR